MPKINMRTWHSADDEDSTIRRKKIKYKTAKMSRNIAYVEGITKKMKLTDHGMYRIKDRMLGGVENYDIARAIAKRRIYEDRGNLYKSRYMVLGDNCRYIIDKDMNVITLFRPDHMYFLHFNQERYRRLVRKEVKDIFGIKIPK